MFRVLMFAPDIKHEPHNKVLTKQPHSIAFTLQLFLSIAFFVEVVATKTVLSISLFPFICPSDQIAFKYHAHIW